MIDQDAEFMTRSELKDEIRRLRAGIRTHRDAKGHDRCWRDDIEVLYAMLPETTEADLRLPPQQEFYKNCRLYWHERQNPMPEKIERFLWEILVPTVMDSKPIRTRFHRVWDSKVREISKGLTILSPARGQWISLDGELFVERMIPVRIACTAEEIERIADMTASYYKQKSVMYYKISDDVVIKNYT